QSGAVFGRLNLEVRIREEGGHRAQHHRSDKGSHRGNALRHDDDHSITEARAVVAKGFSLQACAVAKLGEGYRLTFVFVDPSRNKLTICRSRIECFNKIANLVHAAVIVSGESKGFQIR